MTFLSAYMGGLGVTLALMVLALSWGLIVAFLLTILSEIRFFIFPLLINAFTFLIRGTPLLVQLFIIYYGSGQWTWLHHTFVWKILQYPFGCAVLALGINTCAYTTVLLQGAIQAIPEGEVAVCQALGMTRWQMLCHILLPRAARMTLPAYTNEVVMMLKSTSLVSTITLMDILGVTRQYIALTFDTFGFLLLTALIYLALNLALLSLFHYFVKRWSMASIS